jgi:ABC-type oligopeptide transport system substrate-binding subunit
MTQQMSDSLAMKTRQILSLLAGLALSASLASQASAATSKTPDNVTVTFQDPDHFTDARDSRTNQTSMATLDELRDYVQQTAAPLLAAGSKLSVTFIDLDLAGQLRPDKDNIRVMTDITFPRAQIKFQLLGADGKVVKEGERHLTDVNYLQSVRVQGRSDPLFHDKQLLKDWLETEFKANH